MNIDAEVANFEKMGIKLWVTGDKLKFDAPQELMTEERISYLRKNKSRIVDYLSKRAVIQSSDVQIARASEAQKRFWLTQRITDDGSVFNIPLAIRIIGPLDIKALASAIETVYDRHSVLRSKIYEEKEVVYQQVVNDRHFSVQFEQISDEQIFDWIERELAYSFNLSEDILIRANILQINANQHILFVNMHHAISDGWSMGIFAKEVLFGYNSLLKGGRENVEPLPLQYIDYCQMNKEQHILQELDYWRKQLEGSCGGINFPTDYLRNKRLNMQAGYQELSLPHYLVEKLNQYCRENRFTQFNVLLAVYVLLLGKYTGDSDISVGVPVAGREGAEVETLIGCFINSLVLRNQIDQTLEFTQWVNKVQSESFSAFENQRVSFDRLVEELNPVRVEGRHPFFQTMFALQNEMMPSVQLDELQIEPLKWQREYTQSELTLRLEVHNGRISGYFEYVKELFAESSISELCQHYIALLEQALTSPEHRLSQYSGYSDEQYQRWIVSWNNTRLKLPNEQSVGAVFKRIATQNHQRKAVTIGKHSLTYHQLDEWSNSIAYKIVNNDIGQGEKSPGVVAVCLPRGLQLAASLLGVFKSGFTYLPLDPELPDQRLSYILKKVTLAALITTNTLSKRFGNLAAPVIIDTDINALKGDKKSPVQYHFGVNHPAYLIFTSGSTGEPKGTLVSHSNLINYACAQNQKLKLTQNDTLLQLASIGFDVFFEEVICAWFSGANLVFKDDERILVRAKDLLEFINEYQITCVNLTTAHWHTLMQEIKDQGLQIPKCIGWVIIGGEAVQPDKLDFWQSLEISLLHLYGQTETCCDSTAYVLLANQKLPVNQLPIGRPIANTQVYILDEFMTPVPRGAYGEIYIGGVGVAIGYIGERELTAKKFIPDFVSKVPGGRLCRTGDRGRINAQGELEFGGRVDNQVKIRGYRIELSEIELVLSLHHRIQDAVLNVLEERGEKQIVAYCVADDPGQDLASDLRDCIKQKLPAYCLPSFFIWLDKIPLNTNGKVDKNLLPGIENAQIFSRQEITSPRNELESTLHQLWGELLVIDTISIDDNFFELGGHSLIMSRLAGRIEQVIGITIPLSHLFEAQSIEEQANLILGYQLEEFSEEQLLEALEQL